VRASNVSSTVCFASCDTSMRLSRYSSMPSSWVQGSDNFWAIRRDRKTASGQVRRKLPQLLAATSKVLTWWTGNRSDQA